MVKEDLKCPVCVDVPVSLPIFQCFNGHIMCNSCFPKLESCPVCRVDLILPIRALTAENIWRKMLQECKHKGCNQQIQLRYIEEHENTCDMRPSCPMLICEKRFAELSLLQNHMKTHPRLQCSICKKAFPQKKDLKTHLRFHDEEKPYVCPYCNLAFTLKRNMKTHVQRSCPVQCFC